MRNLSEESTVEYYSREPVVGQEKIWKAVSSSYALQSPGRGKSLTLGRSLHRALRSQEAGILT